MATHHREVETKLEPPEGAALPGFEAAPRVASTTAPLELPLDAEYFDTADLALAEIADDEVAAAPADGGPSDARRRPPAARRARDVPVAARCRADRAGAGGAALARPRARRGSRRRGAARAAHCGRRRAARRARERPAGEPPRRRAALAHPGGAPPHPRGPRVGARARRRRASRGRSSACRRCSASTTTRSSPSLCSGSSACGRTSAARTPSATGCSRGARAPAPWPPSRSSDLPGRGRARSGDTAGWADQPTTSFLFMNSSMPCGPSSRPKPDRFVPPKGMS